MKITCGIDIVEVSRIENAIINLGNKFLNKIYTKAEIEYCESKKEIKYQCYAARFAAKEAIFKAMSDLLKEKNEITWTDVEILHDEKQKPYVHFIKKQFEIEQIDISLSHVKECAIANCIIVSK